MENLIFGIDESNRARADRDNHITAADAGRITARDPQRVVGFEGVNGIIAVAASILDHFLLAVDRDQIVALARVDRHIRAFVISDRIVVGAAADENTADIFADQSIFTGAALDRCIVAFREHVIIARARIDRELGAVPTYERIIAVAEEAFQLRRTAVELICYVIIAAAGLDCCFRREIVDFIIAVARVDRNGIGIKVENGIVAGARRERHIFASDVGNFVGARRAADCRVRRVIGDVVIDGMERGGGAGRGLYNFANLYRGEGTRLDGDRAVADLEDVMTVGVAHVIAQTVGDLKRIDLAEVGDEVVAVAEGISDHIVAENGADGFWFEIERVIARTADNC